LARKAPAEVREINLNDSIRSICGMLEQTIGKDISIEFRFESEPSFVEANDSEVEQILLNLTMNARDAMPDGGTLTFATQKEGNELLLRIVDTGTGIRKEVLSNIFDPFFTTKDKTRGSGLGLSVVHSLMQRIGGSIDVQSEIGHRYGISSALSGVCRTYRKHRRWNGKNCPQTAKRCCLSIRDVLDGAISLKRTIPGRKETGTNNGG
jgi:signal transduction histidine kinase